MTIADGSVISNENGVKGASLAIVTPARSTAMSRIFLTTAPATRWITDRLKSI